VGWTWCWKNQAKIVSSYSDLAMMLDGDAVFCRALSAEYFVVWDAAVS
jgi:lipopolysaccharide biosynthesis glycosyltransferase